MRGQPRSLRSALALLGGLLALGPALPGRADDSGDRARVWPASPGGDGALWKLDARLLPAALSPEPVTVWVGFRDKGESGPAGLAVALAAARASLAPRALARRVRAGVAPLVDYHDLPLHVPYVEALAARGLAPFGASRWLNQVALRVPGTRLREVAALPFVERVAGIERLTRSPDPASGSRAAPGWRGARAASASAIDYGRTADPLTQIDLPAVHDSGYVGTGVLICVLDEGFNAHDTHEALRDVAIAPGHRRDFVEGDTIVTDLLQPLAFGHGSQVLAILAGKKPGAYMGAAFGADYALGRTEVHASEHRIEMIYWGMGAEWADSLGADIISSSLGYTTFDPPDPGYAYGDMNGHTTIVSRAAEIAASKGILVVNSAGNEGSTLWRHLVAPADVSGDSLIAVGAVDASGVVAGFSSRGPTADGRIKPDLVARGKDSPLISPAGGPAAYETGSGTSFSAPLVAGLAACLMQARPAWRPVDVIRALRETASQVWTPDDDAGFGIPDGVRALRWDPSASPPGPWRPNAGPAAEVLGPNPLRAGGPPARIRFTAGGFIQRASPARIRVLDVRGRTIDHLWSGLLARGEYVTVAWDGRDDGRRMVDPGIYFVALEVGGRVAAARVAALR